MKAIAVLSKQFLLFATLPLLILPALADQTWKGSVNNQWDVAGNWSGSALPASADAAIFNNLSTPNLGGVLGEAFTIQAVVVSNVPGAVSISDPSSSILTLAPTTSLYTNVVGSTTNRMPLGIGMANATQNLAITVPVALGSTQAWVVASGQTLDVSGPVSGATWGIYKDGLGTLTLEGTNSFTGSFVDNGGAVWINNSLALGGGGSTRSIWIANNALGAGLHLNGTNGSIVLPVNLQFDLSQQYGAIINEAGSNVITGNMYVQSGGGLAYVLANAGTLVLNGPIGLSVSARQFQVGGAGNGIINGNIGGTAGAGFPFTKTDSGTWTLTNHNSYTGVTVIQGGTLALSPTATIANTPSIMLLSNATFDVSALAPFNLSGSVSQTLGGSGTVTGSVASVSTTYIVPGGTNAAGTLTFTNDLSLPNATALFELNTATTAGSGINDLLNVGGNLDAESANIFVTILNPLTSPGTYRLVNYNTESTAFNPTVTTDTRYTFALVDSGGSPGYIDVNVTGSISNLDWSGDNGATWDLNTSYNWDSDTQTFYNFDAVTFDDSSANNTVSITATVRPSSVLVTNNTANYTFSGSGKITGLTGVTKAGAGTLLMSDANHDFTGPFTINGGTVAVTTFATSGSPSPLGAGTTITLNGGAFQFGGARPAASTVNRYWTLGPNGGTVLSTNGTFFLANQISGSGSLTKTGSVQIILGDINTGVLSTGASNTYSGNTYITQGELQIRNNHALGFGKAVVAVGADLAFGGGVNYGTITNNIDLNGGDGNGNAGALQVNDANTVATYGGTINLLGNSSVGSFTAPSSFTISGPIIGPGLLTKTNHVTCTVILTCPTNSYSGGTFVTGGTLQLGSGGSCGSLGTGTVTNNGTLAYNHSDSIVNNSAIYGSGSLTHTGAGTLTLGGANTYSGTTTVNGGTLLVNGALAGGAVGVAGGATLGGFGTIGGPVTVSSGGTLALGASIGTLTINNVLNLGGTCDMKVSHIAGAANDSIAGVTTLTFGGALDVTATGTLQAGDTFKLFNATTYDGNFSSTVLPALTSGLLWDTSGLTNNGTIKVTTGSSPVISSLKVLASGNVQLTFSGSSGANYRIWASTNVAFRPVTNTWSNLWGGTFGSGSLSYTDPQANSYSRRFYVITSP